MGIETRDLIPESDEYYSADYVEDQSIEYKWGSNLAFFNTLSEIRYLYSELKDVVENQELLYLNTSSELSACWLYYDNKELKPSYFFILNINAEKDSDTIEIFDILNSKFKYNKNLILEEIYSNIAVNNKTIKLSDVSPVIINMEFGECKIFKCL